MSRYLPGDVVKRRKGLVMHKGIALGDGHILHNTPSRGEHVSTEADFRRGHSLHVDCGSRAERERALHAAEHHPRRDYNLFTNNCEHTVHRAATGKARSPQLAGWAAGIGVAALTFALTRHPGLSAAGYAMGRGIARRLTRG